MPMSALRALRRMRARPHSPISRRFSRMSTATETPTVRYMDAIREGIAAEMRTDPTVCLLGIDVGSAGGIFAVSRGLYDEFGGERIRDTPISEAAFVGAAGGA